MGESGPPIKVDGVSSQRTKKGRSFDRPFRARDETRTHTGFTPLAPETSASTISPPALWDCKYSNFLEIRTGFIIFPSPCTFWALFVHALPYFRSFVHIFPAFCAPTLCFRALRAQKAWVLCTGAIRRRPERHERDFVGLRPPTSRCLREQSARRSVEGSRPLNRRALTGAIRRRPERQRDFEEIEAA